MARVIFSALFSAASGRIGDVVCSKWKGIPYVRRRVVPANPQSGDQCLQRYMLKVALLLWQSIKSWAKVPWDLNVSGEALSGYNQFMDNCIAALIPQFTAGGIAEDPTWSTPAVTVGSPYNAARAALLAVDAGTPGDGTVTFTWTKRAGVLLTDYVHLLSRLDDATAWTYHESVKEDLETYAFTGLTNDSQYEFMLVSCDNLLTVFSESIHKLQTPSAA